ncbi:GAF domain-containing sensor histidine kinase [Nocardioides taihuensis]|uniref:Oxygen sensor histidine kinase NreB n=1 Tax=Nocardioides taihuensis TaxID=1835606 RepID=A0ABW0BJQ7_9ACTN
MDARWRWTPTLRRRSRREWLSVGVVGGGLVAFVVLTYLAVVVGGGAVTDDTGTPSLGLSVLATALVALGFDPVLGRLERFTARVVQQGRPAPYDALRRFSAVVSADQPAEDLPLRMARLLAEGTGAEWAQVWVSVGGALVPTATWPPEAEQRLAATPGWDPGTRRLPVLHGGEELGLLVLRERPGAALTPVEQRLFATLAGQAGLVLRGAQLRGALDQRLAELSTREAELRESRVRLVDAQDAARRHLERDIHDGAQQHLVALAVNLRLAAALASSDPARAVALLDEQEEAAAGAVTALAQLARGIYPPLLEEQGLAAAIRAAVGDAAEVVADSGTRYPPAVEAAAYFCCLEAVQNATKHAGVARVRVELGGGPDELQLTVEDDGEGFDPTAAAPGTGLANMRDRVDAAGGTWELDTAPGRGTRVCAVLPARAAAGSPVGG